MNENRMDKNFPAFVLNQFKSCDIQYMEVYFIRKKLKCCFFRRDSLYRGAKYHSLKT